MPSRGGLGQEFLGDGCQEILSLIFRVVLIPGLIISTVYKVLTQSESRPHLPDQAYVFVDRTVEIFGLGTLVVLQLQVRDGAAGW
jgi:hypothetical protein